MTFNAVESTFNFDGITYVVKRKPRRFWACQSCDLAPVCAERIGQPDFPECRGSNREDHVDVVFFRQFTTHRGGRR